MRELVWTSPALADLRSIEGWLEQAAGPRFAVQMLSAIRERATFLYDFPHGGRPEADGSRVLRVLNTPYLILYRLTPERTELLRIRHEREDWQVDF